LIEAELAASLQVSRTPVRESLPRLAAEGLIVSRGRGWVVLEHSADEIREIYDVRAALEGYASLLAAERATPEQVEHIVAHGTSTPLNDATETKAIRAAFGAHADRIAVTSNKSMLGHTLGAAGAMSGLAAVLAIRDGLIPPTINYQTPDPACDVDVVANTARSADLNVVMINGFGFGGQNAAAIIGRHTG